MVMERVMTKYLFDEIFCTSCHKFYAVSELNIIDGMAECLGECGSVHILDDPEPPIVARLAKEGDRERRI